MKLNIILLCNNHMYSTKNLFFSYLIFVIPEFLMTFDYGLHQIAHEEKTSTMKDFKIVRFNETHPLGRKKEDKNQLLNNTKY